MSKILKISDKEHTLQLVKIILMITPTKTDVRDSVAVCLLKPFVSWIFLKQSFKSEVFGNKQPEIEIRVLGSENIGNQPYLS